MKRFPSIPPPRVFSLDDRPALANWARYAATSAFRSNSLRRSFCKPTAHCNKSRDPVDLMEKLCLRRKAWQYLGSIDVKHSIVHTRKRDEVGSQYHPLQYVK